MVSPRRIGVESFRTRAALLDATERIMMEEGYAAVTSRRLANRAGLKPQLVHYYFRTMDDLFLALIRRGAERNLEQLSKALASARPLRALWDLSSQPAAARLALEYMALANHRKAIGAEIARHAEIIRALEARALSRLLADHAIGPEVFPGVSVAVLISSLSRVLAMELALGVTSGHRETLVIVRRYLRQFETPRVASQPPSSALPITRRPAPASARFSRSA